MQAKRKAVVISLGQVYDLHTLAEVMALDKSIKSQHIEHVIVDARELRGVDSMSLELLELRKQLPDARYGLLFVGLPPALTTIWPLPDEHADVESLLTFDSVESAIAFINSL